MFRQPVRSITPVFRKITACAWLAFAAFVAATQTCSVGTAQAFPDRPLRIIVPFPPGGPLDIMTRVYAQRLSEGWKQPVVVENRAGGNSAIGAQQVARAAPDGYTLLVAMDTTLVMNPLTVTNLSYDAQKDFVLVSLMAQNPALLLVPGGGAADVADLVVRAKSQPGKLSYGAGVLPTRLAGYLFNKLAGIDAVFVAYKGSAEVAQGLLTSSIDYAFDGVAPYLSLIERGQVRPLAKLNNNPLPQLPAMRPLADVAQLPELGEFSIWSGLAAPAGTPPALVELLQRAIAAASSDPAVRDRLHQMGIYATSSTSGQFSSFVKAETAKWGRVVEESGFKMN
jgi:tripartite-type tricarboxylate transporter receptor subunit TctC